MPDRPNWLRPVLVLNPIPHDIYNQLYAIFEQDLINGRVSFRGCPIYWDRRVFDSGYQEGFWHIISREDYSLGERILDTRRAEKIRWCTDVIKNSDHSLVTVFDHKEGNGTVRTYFWLEAFDYVVILERRKLKVRGSLKEVMWLKTAFHVDGDSTRRSLTKKKNRGIP